MSLDPPRPDFMPRQRGDGGPLLEAPARLRMGLLGLGGVLALGGLWMLLSALLAPETVALPLDREAPRPPRLIAAARSPRRGLASSGETSTRRPPSATPGFSGSSGRIAQQAASAAEVQAARSNAETALALAPVNGSAWFLLAALPPASAKPGGRKWPRRSANVLSDRA